ncbi:hypothetical protein BGX26_011235 [Mortierella sp. AD094]|nr:hypothetical protein BGX26_011235 [Mortierella sp. AD094]
MPAVPIQPVPPFTNINILYQGVHPMELQYQHPAQAPGLHFSQHQQHQQHQQQQQQQQQQSQQHPYDQYNYSHDHDGYGSNSNYHYSGNHGDIHNNLDSSKRDSPVPYISENTNDGSKSNNDSDTANDGYVSKTHKGKVFQCTGFGDCRMVFTRSEHLARHARKHTGEKPFQCVVEGCTRMFSRFDNMVQHTQTHTKGAHRETAEGIANKIAIESRRKSEVGLLGSTVARNGGARGIKAKRGSISIGSSSESLNKGRRERIQSVPMLNMTAATAHHRSSTPVFPSPVTPSSTSPLSPRKQTRQRPKTLGRESGKIRKRQCSIRSRRGSLESSVHHSPTESWYASKLHHRPSLDYGLDQHAFFITETRNDVNQTEAQVPPMSYCPADSNHYHPFAQYSPSFSCLRHPLSPEHSSHSDDMDSDDGASVHGYQNQFYSEKPISAQVSMEECRLPPLRSSLLLPEAKPVLPSIAYGRIRSQSIASNGSEFLIEPRLANNKTRRLSLVDLNAPIQEATMAVHHSMQAPMNSQTSGGVDVSEDEIKALEAFGELWSQGRDVEVGDRQSATTMTSSIGAEAPVPGPDVGRRTPFDRDDTFQHYPKVDMYLN